MRRFRFESVACDEGHNEFPHLLARAHRGKIRPLCLCRDPGVPMYIADIGDQLLIKRMPLSGGGHDPACPSYDPPYELSGLGPLMGSAIKLDPSSGVACLKLDFSLSKRAATNQVGSGGEGNDSVKVESKKLSLRALLHFLWHESGLTEWTSHWTGKRHWWQVYHHLLEAAGNMAVRGTPLSDRLLLPEPFRAHDKTAIGQRRAHKLARLFLTSAGPKQLMVLVGEIKEFAEARGGRQVVIKHMPGFRLYLEEIAWTSVQRRFEPELALWHSSEASHLMMIATIGGDPAGIIAVNEIALMAVTEQWLPIEDAYEQRLVERLARLKSKYVKGLRFNLRRDHPLANATLSDVKPQPLALYIVPPSADEAFEACLREMIEARPDLSAWIWRVADGEMPPLPI
ncbi:DUF1173 domain-containing protein [Rhizobium sp. P32RR-XVIII]|uniref:DUF1173 domain-containing protein n=1 Tax=Rhizobium sp. P32RR-XVIII TaxID=2726738 RepID=UPI0014565963|nr:DUF1173 domain-containing protein [Rhizobium sp. P32RR-XVIII]NLS07125.1 DUF1173 domain-containing protein [Rhizobium sp. P32RR-XVIII]